MRTSFIFICLCTLFFACAKSDVLEGMPISLSAPAFDNTSIIFFAEQHYAREPVTKTIRLILDYNKTPSRTKPFTHIVFEYPRAWQLFLDDVQPELLIMYDAGQMREAEMREQFFNKARLFIVRDSREKLESAQKSGAEGVNITDTEGFVEFMKPVYEIISYNMRVGRTNKKEIKIMFTDTLDDAPVTEETITLRNMENVHSILKEYVKNPDAKTAVFCGSLHLHSTYGKKDSSLPGLIKEYGAGTSYQTVSIFGGLPTESDEKAANMFILPNAKAYKMVGQDIAGGVSPLSREEYKKFISRIRQDFMEEQDPKDVYSATDWVFYFKD